MSRKIKRNLFKSQRTYKNDSLYIGNLSFAQALELFRTEKEELTKPIILAFVITGLSLYTMAQISVSARPEKSEWVEKLPSIKDLKRKVINNKNGRIVAACFGLALAFPYAMDDLEKGGINTNEFLCILSNELVDSHTSNIKRIKPTPKGWLPYSRGEMVAIKGQMLSCPSTNIQILNIDGSLVQSYGVNEAMKRIGIDQSIFDKYEITEGVIKNIMRKLFFVDKGGLPIDKLIYNEPKFVFSKIQNELLGDKLERNNTIYTKMEKELEPSATMTRSFLAKYFTKNQLFAYDIAIRTGDTQMAKKLTNLVVLKSKES